MRLLLDTNTITHILRRREPIVSRFTETLADQPVFISCEIVDYELRRYLLLKGARRQLERYDALSRDWLALPLTREDWHTAARLWAEMHRAGQSIEDRDLLIAVTSLKGGATLVTSNTRHFEYFGFPMQDWAA